MNTSSLSSPPPPPPPTPPHNILSHNKHAGTRVLATPVFGKVYWLGLKERLPGSSVIHQQVGRGGPLPGQSAYDHPVLVIGIEQEFAFFYMLTSQDHFLPSAEEKRMRMRIGYTSDEGGHGVLRLAPGSAAMPKMTLIKLERTYNIEWANLAHLKYHVRVDEDESREKLKAQVVTLEADQNRLYHYMPIYRAVSQFRAGMIIMIVNRPIVLLEVNSPFFRFLDCFWTDGPLPHRCLEIHHGQTISHGQRPVLSPRRGSPDMEEGYYVAVEKQGKQGRQEQSQTWCWPPVELSAEAMMVLRQYMAACP